MTNVRKSFLQLLIITHESVKLVIRNTDFYPEVEILRIGAMSEDVSSPNGEGTPVKACYFVKSQDTFAESFHLKLVRKPVHGNRLKGMRAQSYI